MAIEVQTTRAPPDEGRAKRWGCSPFFAQWIANVVHFCHNTSEGRAAFRKWITAEKPHDAVRILRFQHLEAREMQDVPRQDRPWYAASLELNLRFELVKVYFDFNLHMPLDVVPPRVLPPPWRKPNEAGYVWYKRRYDARLDGSDFPDFDFASGHAIALSELDRYADMITLWRTTPAYFVRLVAERQSSMLPTPSDAARCRSKDELTLLHKDDAVRNYLFVTGMAHWTWYQAAELFEEFARRGATTRKQVEAAYEVDHTLLWRLVSVFASVHNVRLHTWGRLIQSVPASPHFAPYFRRYRDPEGYANLEKNWDHIKKHGYGGNPFVEAVVACMVDGGAGRTAFAHRVAMYLTEDPANARLLSQESYDFLGEFMAVNEFIETVVSTPFGSRAAARARKLERMPEEKQRLLDAALPYEPGQVLDWVRNVTPVGTQRFGLVSLLVETVSDVQRHILATLGMRDTVAHAAWAGAADRTHWPHWDGTWSETDYGLWWFQSLGPPTDAARPGREFGLVSHAEDLAPELRLNACDHFFPELHPSRKDALKARTTPAWTRPDLYAALRPKPVPVHADGDASKAAVGPNGVTPGVADPSSADVASLSTDVLKESGKAQGASAAAKLKPLDAAKLTNSSSPPPHVKSKWDIAPAAHPVLPPPPPSAAPLTWESLIADAGRVVWADEPEPEFLVEAMHKHKMWEPTPGLVWADEPEPEWLVDAVAKMQADAPARPAPTPPPPEPEPEPVPEPIADAPAPKKEGKKKCKGPPPVKKVKPPPPAPTPKKVKPPPPPPPPPRPPTPPPLPTDQPDMLPAEFQLPKKMLKIIHRFMGHEEPAEDAATKKAQLRWADLERVMRRLGFTTVDYAGSLMRFEPPARTARPISFFHPHPEGEPMDDMSVKIVGARLQRCYGWRVETFQKGAEAA